jgi:hypothetical protein
MLAKTKIVFAAALVLGTASAALAGSENTEDRGGFVIPGSMDGVNPVLHPDYFPNASKAARTSNATKASGRARGSYAQAHVRPSPNADSNPSTKPTAAVRPFTSFEKNWFDYQSHDDQ